MIERRKTFASLAVLVATISAVAVLTVSGSTSAQQNRSGGNALRISPVRTDLTIEPGKSKTVDVVVQNMSGSSAVLHPVINDFTVRPDNETGQPDIILDESKTAPRHSLKRYVGPLSDFTLKANEQKTIKVTVSIPAGTAGGGYYGAVRFEPASTNSNSQVSLSGSVGSLVLVRVPGNITEKVNIESFDVRKDDVARRLFNTNKDLKAVVRFNNEGNVQLQPFGKINLKDRSGKVVATYEVNNTDPRGNVLPDSIRRFEINLDKVGSFGKYTVEGNFGYGSNGQLLTASKSFWVIPTWMFILVGVLIAAIVAAIFLAPRLVKSYNARIIGKASRKR